MSFTDITETKKRLYASLVESKMMLIGEFASGFAHEVSNPLTIVLGNLELLAADPSLSEENREIVREALKAVKRASDITKSLVRLSYGTKEDRVSRIDLNIALEKVIELIEPNMKANGISIETHLSEKPLYAEVNPSSIEQVLLNVFLNAIEALSEHQGEKKITVRSYSDAGFVTIEITDTGPGIPEDIIDSIFDPFFSTKERGTGMGLFLAYHLVNEDNGQIEVDSQPGRGTTVRISYPEAK